MSQLARDSPSSRLLSQRGYESQYPFTLRSVPTYMISEMVPQCGVRFAKKFSFIILQIVTVETGKHHLWQVNWREVWAAPMDGLVCAPESHLQP